MEKRKSFGGFRRILAMMLAVVMVVSLIPQNAMTVYAEEFEPQEYVSSKKSTQETAISGNLISDNEIPDNEIPDNQISDDENLEDVISENVISENEISDNVIPESVSANLVDEVNAEADAGGFVIEDKVYYGVQYKVLVQYTGTGGDIVIPDGVARIAAEVFRDNQTITSVECPDSLEVIEKLAFWDCKSLETVTLNKGLLTIGMQAFKGAGFGKKSATGAVTNSTLTIPDTVTSIKDGAFDGCTYLGKIIFEESSDAAQELNIASSFLKSTFGNCPALKEVILPDRLKVIPDYAFDQDTSLETVQFGTNLTTVGKYAFRDCEKLKKVELPENVTSIEEAAFCDCKSLETATLNKGLLTIGMQAFKGAGFGKKSATGAVTNSTLTIPDTVTSIKDGAFDGCTYLGKIIFEESSDAAQELNIASSFLKGTFANCPALKEVILPDRLEVIPDYAFDQDASLETVQFGTNLTTIGISAFGACKKLKKVELPNSVTSIGKLAFYDCKSLETATLNRGLRTIGEQAFRDAAFGKKSSDGTVTNSTLTIPDTVTSIGAGAFANCTYLEKVFFEDSTESDAALELNIDSNILNCTLGNCPALKEVILPDRLTKIPPYMLVGNPKLKILYIPPSVTSIEDNAIVLKESPNLTMYDSLAGVQKERLIFEPDEGKHAFIKDVSLVNGGDAFELEYAYAKRKLMVNKTAALKTNKTYKLTFAVTFEGSAQNAKPVLVNLNVIYKN